jgi:hypothetical protein
MQCSWGTVVINLSPLLVIERMWTREIHDIVHLCILTSNAEDVDPAKVY